MKPDSVEQRIRRHRRRIEYEERTLRQLGFDPEEIPAEKADKILKKTIDNRKPEG